ncbi:hypothetical protein [uncultured Oscillibacter sp.]|uniref:hypothetical protein n=1 Tax=uncultured Oscillibacter sp. TaxID=876091 RepID=UPI0026349694|nr:hypothetical protein [uncultured Oscillibacter sp.]
MLPTTRLKNLYEAPLPPMALTEYEAMSKFLNQGAQRCKVSGRNFDLFLDWAIQALTASLAADSASRVFLPKTRTGPFTLDGLIPISTLPSGGERRVKLSECSLIAPVWNNGALEAALESFYDSGFASLDVDRPFGGAYFQELRLAVIDSPADVDVPNVLRVWSRGSVILPSYSLKDLEPVLSTDGETWFLREGDAEREAPVLEPRMAALYNCGLRRYCGRD